MNPHRTDITGLVSDKLTAIKPSEKRDKCGRVYWECQCECGNKTYQVVSHIKSGIVKSCGKCRDIGSITYYGYELIGKRGLAHRLIWEQYNGPIPKGYIIHHKDFNKLNNDISNLQCMTRKEHNAIHASMRRNKKCHV